jgi:uncharacterized protein YggU (UPF0235/DUF167 family)
MSEEELFREYISLSDDLFYLSGKVIPGAQKTSLVEKMDDGETWKFRVAAPPEKGKANTELVRYLKKNSVFKRRSFRGNPPEKSF